MTMTKKRFLPAAGVIALVALVSCDIGNWDITQGSASQRNFQPFEEIDFLTGFNRTTGEEGTGAFPLIFGTSSHNRGSAILGSGQQSMRFQNAEFQGQAGNQALMDIMVPPRHPGSPGDFNHGLHGQRLPDHVPPGFIEIAATRSGQGGGKIAGSEDGIAFLFREVPLNRNFRMQADFLVVSYGLVNATAPHIPGSNGQEGFGIMVRDFVPQIPGNYPNLPGRQGGGGSPTGTTMAAWDANHRWRFERAAMPGSAATGVGKAGYAAHVPGGDYFLRGMVHNAWLHGDGSTPTITNTQGGSSPRNTSFHYWVGAAGFGADSNMMMAGGTKRGMRIKWRAGIRPGTMETTGGGNPVQSGTQNSGRFRFDYQPRALGDYSFFTESIDGVETATMAERPDFPRWGTTVRVFLERTNDGFRYSIQNLDDTFYNFDPETGRPLPDPATTSGVHVRSLKPAVTSEQPGMGIIPDREILGQVNSTHFYVGLFASRDAVVWVNMNTLVYEEAYSRYTAPATPFRPSPFEPGFSVASSRYYGGVNYLYVTANTSGSLSVTQNGRRIPDHLITGEWIVETQNGIAEPLSLFTVPIWEPEEGETFFNITFHPGNIPRELADRGFAHSSNRSIGGSFTMIRRTFHGGTGDIYVAPLDGRGSVFETEPPFRMLPERPAGRPAAGVFGSPGGQGTRASPLDLQTAVNHVMPGQHIVMLNGTYIMDSVFTIPRFNDGLEWLPNGRSGRKVLRAESVNGVHLDWDKNEDIGPDGMGIIGGEAFLLAGSYWHLDGFHIRGAPNRTKGIVVGGHNNLITRLMTYNNGCTGFQISGRAAEPVRFWPSGNIVKWTESFHNFDIAQTNADGFGVKLTVGARNRFYSSIAHHNNDDAWDLFSKRDTGAIGVVVIEDSIAYRHGNMLNNFETSAGHNGFKMGGEGIGIFHEIRQSLAFANGETLNRGWAITSNSNPNQMVWDTTTVLHDGRTAGNIEVRGGGAGVAAGNTHRSVATVSNRQGGTAAPFSSAFAPDAELDWRGHMEPRSRAFWGEGNTGIGVGSPTRLASNANGPSGTGAVQTLIINGESYAVRSMPGCYSGWSDPDRFTLFFPRDEFFAYPLLGDLYRPPVGFGAHNLYDRNPSVSAANVIRWIPWAAGQDIIR